MGRRDVTKTLTEAAIDFWGVRCKMGVFKEVGVVKWGRLRCDLLCIHMSGEIVGVEIKSSKEDFRADKKMQNYLPYLDKFYLVLPPSIVKYVKGKLAEREWGDVVGIYTLGHNGYLKCKKPAKQLETIAPEERIRLLSKLAWRCAEYSRRNRKRRTRRFLTK